MINQIEYSSTTEDVVIGEWTCVENFTILFDRSVLTLILMNCIVTGNLRDL